MLNGFYPPNLPPPPTVRISVIDWRAYFLKFVEEHGSDPVEYKGRLLFRDGWQYSASDYAGPEYPAPLDNPEELKRLTSAYWRVRRVIILRETAILRNNLKGIVAEQAMRRIPLQQRTRFWDPDTRTWREVKGEIDLTDMRDRLDWLERGLEECEKILSQANRLRT